MCKNFKPGCAERGCGVAKGLCSKHYSMGKLFSCDPQGAVPRTERTVDECAKPCQQSGIAYFITAAACYVRGRFAFAAHAAGAVSVVVRRDEAAFSRFCKAFFHSQKAENGLPRRHGTFATPAWHVCHAGVVRLPCRRGKVSERLSSRECACWKWLHGL